MQRHLIYTTLIVILISVTFGFSQLSDMLQIHGFGGWAAGYTDNDNNFLFANNDFNLGEYSLSLNLMAKPTENILVNSQIFFGKEQRWRPTGPDTAKSAYKRTSSIAEIDYLFMHYSFSSLFSVRLGKVMSPIGLYSEIYDVGTLRPFYLLPVGMYQGPGMFPKSYLGVGFTGRYNISSSWDMAYDIIGGEIYFNKFYVEIPTEAAWTGIPGMSDLVITNAKKLSFQPVGKGMFGIQLGAENSELGLKFGGSYLSMDVYASRDDGPVEKGDETNRHTLYHFFAEYLTESISLRTEYYTIPEYTKNNSFYVEAAYKFFKHWQAAVSYDVYENLDESTKQRTLHASTLKHNNIGLGINYWFNPNIVLKANYYNVKYNTHAAPDWNYQHTSLEEKTNVLIFGTQFSF